MMGCVRARVLRISVRGARLVLASADALSVRRSRKLATPRGCRGTTHPRVAAPMAQLAWCSASKTWVSTRAFMIRAVRGRPWPGCAGAPPHPTHPRACSMLYN